MGTQITSWEDYDKENLRKISTILRMERELNKETEKVYGWSVRMVAHLYATIGERK